MRRAVKSISLKNKTIISNLCPSVVLLDDVLNLGWLERYIPAPRAKAAIGVHGIEHVSKVRGDAAGFDVLIR